MSRAGALLRYAQQVATAHAEAVGLDDALYRKTHTAYVLAKLALHVTRLPRVDEELTLVTQPERCKRAVNKRITHFLRCRRGRGRHNGQPLGTH